MRRNDDPNVPRPFLITIDNSRGQWFTMGIFGWVDFHLYCRLIGRRPRIARVQRGYNAQRTVTASSGQKPL